MRLLMDTFLSIGNFENKKWRSHYRRTTTGLHEWTGGPFMEPCILLEIASTLPSFPSLIYKLMFLRLYVGLLL